MTMIITEPRAYIKTGFAELAMATKLPNEWNN